MVRIFEPSFLLIYKLLKMSRRKNLRIGDKVILRFIGSTHKAKVIDIDKSDGSYKLETSDGTIFSKSFWEHTLPKDKNGKIKDPWYIEKLVT